MPRTTEQRKASWTPERRANVSAKVRAHVAKRKAEFVIPKRKVCRVCHIEKPLSAFPRHPMGKDGHLNHCQACINAKAVASYQRKPKKPKKVKPTKADFLASLPSDFKLKCKGCGVEQSLTEFHKQSQGKYGVRSTCKTCVAKQFQEIPGEEREARRLRQDQWRKDNPDSTQKILRKSRIKHKDRIAKRSKERRVSNIQAFRERERSYAKRNPAQMKAKNGRRRAAETQAVPKWLTPIQKAHIQSFYEIAIARDMQTGVKHHVDHIVPLRGEGVRGLHVPWNLQVLTEAENCSKHNKLMEEES